MINNWLSLPLVNPLLFLVQIVSDDVDLGKWSILNFGSLLVSSAVLDVVKVVLIGLHAHLAICVLLIWNRLQ